MCGHLTATNTMARFQPLPPIYFEDHLQGTGVTLGLVLGME